MKQSPEGTTLIHRRFQPPQLQSNTLLKVLKGRPYLIGGFNLREPTTSKVTPSVQIRFLPQSAFQM